MKEKKMKKRTLNQTWILCLRMFRWIIKQENVEERIGTLKYQWISDNGFGYVPAHCFFCDFGKGSCRKCPGKLVDPNFQCTAPDYHYSLKPKAFYKELLRLNRIRKGGK